MRQISRYSASASRRVVSTRNGDSSSLRRWLVLSCARDDREAQGEALGGVQRRRRQAAGGGGAQLTRLSSIIASTSASEAP